MSKPKILIMAGGTGGHVFPALAIAEALKKQAIEVAWLGTEHGLEAQLVPEQHIQLFTIDVFGLRSTGIKRALLAPWNLSKALWQSWRVFRKFQPTAVLGMGGFASGPGGIMAFLLRKKLILHEQNSIPGLTNKILARVATNVFEAFPNSFPNNKKVHCIGNPIRENLLHLPVPTQRFQNRSGILRILVLGGSRGAMALNVQIPQALAQLNTPVEIWHQAGECHLAAAEQAYKESQLPAKITAFIKDMAEAYQWADVVICRSGAMTVSEITTVGVAAIFVPFPYAVDDHQTHNAEFLVNAGAAKLIQQKDLTSEALVGMIASLNKRELLLAMAERAYQLRKIDAVAEMVRGLRIEG